MNRKKLFAVIGGVSFFVVVVFNAYQSSNQVKLSDLALENVAALARGENPTDPNVGRGMKKVNCTKNGVITGTKCETAGPYDECNYRYDITGKCD